jgi:ABC-2 type transport system ATP-binding protein
MAYIEVKDMTKAYGRQIVLSHISVDWEKGLIHGLIGRNGSGKTQLFKCVCGYVSPDSGTVQVDGKVIGKEVPYPQSMGLLLENPGFLPGYSGLFNLQLLAAIRSKLTKTELITCLQRVGLTNVGRKHYAHYSLGMKQRLGIAQAIMENPNLIILDEPFNGLDNAGVREIRKLLLDLASEGKTILLSSHNAEDINQLCATVHEMEAGVIRRIR